ncbi:MAG: radical SAM protein [Syntrophus sp. (in: bacteria)]|nr:radical SAM protein [Syntrophus sp. (in: bacteria)]
MMIIMNRYAFGPVPSRRLGFSLGVDAIPAKYCTFDCIYCQIGKTTCLEIERKGFFDPFEIVHEVINTINEVKHVDFVTFSGSGEPTLNSDLGLMIREIKKRTDSPVAVITNGSLMCNEEVRKDLLAADVVLPSLDGVSDDIFRYINRPHALIVIDTIIEGLKTFRQEYDGQIWLEIMMIKDVNDEPEELRKFKDIINQLKPDKIHLNTVTRPPAEEIRGKMEVDDLEKVCRYFGEKCEIICTFEKSIEDYGSAEGWELRVLDILKRRSMSLDDIVKITGISHLKAKSRLSILEYEGRIKGYHFGDNVYYVSAEVTI